MTVWDSFRGEGTASKSLKETEKFCRILGRKDMNIGQRIKLHSLFLVMAHSDKEHEKSKLGAWLGSYFKNATISQVLLIASNNHLTRLGFQGRGEFVFVFK